MEIQERLLTPNPYSRRQKPNKPTQIIVHYVGNPGSSALGNRNYFEGLKVGKVVNGKYMYASSHYVIGLLGECIRCVPENEEAIHAGNNSVNVTSIGIEICHPDWTGKFNSETEKTVVELCVDICKRYNLDPIKDVKRHFDITKKNCPRYWVAHPEDFERFKKEVKTLLTVDPKEQKIQETVNALVNAKAKDGKTPVTAYPESWKAIFNGTQTTKGEHIMTLVRRLMKLE